MHETTAVDGVRQRSVHGAGVVPDERVAALPLVPIDVLRLGRPVAKAREQRTALLHRQPDHVVRRGAEQQGLAPGPHIRLVDNVVHPIKDGFDVAFGTGPLQDSMLITRKVFSLEMFLRASPDFVAQLTEPITAPPQLNTLPFIDCGFYGGPRKLVVAKQKRRYELSPIVRARTNNFQVCKQYVLRGLGIGAMPNQIIVTTELREGSIVPVLPDWSLERLDVYMIHPFQLSFSTLISAFYEAACEIITENSARS